MILHLTSHELRRHPAVYPLAALLFFATQFLPGFVDEGTTATLLIGTVFIGAVIVHLLMRSHPWHDDRAFWRTRPIAPRQLLVSQASAVAVVVLLPVAAGLLMRILPLDLGALPTSLAILIPAGVVLGLSAALAACAALTGGRGRRDIVPYLAAFVAPLLSAVVFGWFKWMALGPNSGPTTGGEILGALLCTLAVAAGVALLALLLGTLARRRRAAVLTMLLAGISLPWISGLLRVDPFPPVTPVRRDLGVQVARTDNPRPAWTGLAATEFFAPRVIHASWTLNGDHVAWMWPRNNHRSHPDFRSDLLRQSHHQPLENQHNQFAAAADVDAMWDGIRARLPDHAGWRPAESAPYHPHEPPRLGDGPRLPRFELSASGEVYRLEAIDPISPIAPGDLAEKRAGRLEIRRVAHDDSRIVILLRRRFPNPSLTSGFARPNYFFSTAPPEFWAVLLHHPSSTAYACHGLRVRVGQLEGTGTIIHTRHHLLEFHLPRLETRLLGLDPQQLLANSTLHLFQAVPIARGEAKHDQ